MHSAVVRREDSSALKRPNRSTQRRNDAHFLYRLKTMRAFLTAFVVIASAAGVAAAQSPLPLKYTGGPTHPAITAADAMTRLYIFADDSMLGRGAGEIGGLKGTAYIEREVRRLGLIPAGDSGTFFQAVPLYKRSLDTNSSLSANGTPLVIGRDYYPLIVGGTPRSLNGA